MIDKRHDSEGWQKIQEEFNNNWHWNKIAVSQRRVNRHIFVNTTKFKHHECVYSGPYEQLNRKTSPQNSTNTKAEYLEFQKTRLLTNERILLERENLQYLR